MALAAVGLMYAQFNKRFFGDFLVATRKLPPAGAQPGAVPRGGEASSVKPKV